MIPVAAALALSRFVEDAATLLLWGSTAFRAALVPAPLAACLSARLRGWDRALVLAACAATALKLPAGVAAIGEGWHDALDPTVIRAVLFETGAGKAWMEQALCCALLVAARRLPTRGGIIATAVASGLLLVGSAMTGHAAMQEGWVGALHRMVDVAHVLAGGAWLGALLPVLIVLDLLALDERRRQAMLALRRFSRAGHVAVALVLLSGLANTALVLGHWPTDLHSPYEALLAVKIALVALMAGLALVNRYVLVPRIGRAASDASAMLRLGTLAEIPLGLAAIALVAFFGLLDPQ